MIIVDWATRAEVCNTAMMRYGGGGGNVIPGLHPKGDPPFFTKNDDTS